MTTRTKENSSPTANCGKDVHDAAGATVRLTVYRAANPVVLRNALEKDSRKPRHGCSVTEDAKMLGLNETDEEIFASEVTDEELEAADGMQLMTPTFWNITYCFGCPPVATGN